MNVSREKKLNELQLENKSEHLSDYALNIIYEKYLTMKDKMIDIYSEENPSEAVLKKVKESIILKILNEILVISNLPQIERLEDFREISLNIIVNDNTKIVFQDMSDEISKYFDKVKCGYYRNYEKSPNYQLNILKGLVQCTGYKFNRTVEVVTTNKIRTYEKSYTITK